MTGVAIAFFMGSLDQTIVATGAAFNREGSAGSRKLFRRHHRLSDCLDHRVADCGKLSDVYGRKRFLLGGIAWFVVASVLCGLAQTMTQLIVFRNAQGTGRGGHAGRLFRDELPTFTRL